MLGAEAPRRSSSGRMRDAARPLVSLRSPLPLMVAGIGVTILVIAVVTLPPRPAPPDPSQTATLGDAEALTLVAHEMRSSAAAARVLNDGQVRFNDGTQLGIWTQGRGGSILKCGIAEVGGPMQSSSAVGLPRVHVDAPLQDLHHCFDVPALDRLDQGDPIRCGELL